MHPPNTIEIKKSRLDYFDAAKGLAIIAVILGHCNLGLVNSFVYSFHLPLFFIISGYFSNPCTTISHFTKKRFKQLIVPYLISSGIIVMMYTVDSYVHAGYWPSRTAFKNIVIATLYASGGEVRLPWGNIPSIGAIWFLPAIFIAQIIWRYALSKKYPFLLMLVIAFIGYYSSKTIWLPLSIQAGMTCCVFIFVGSFIRSRNIDFSSYSRSDAACTLVCLAVWCINVIFFPHFYLVNNHMQGGALNMIGGVCASLLIIKFCPFIQQLSCSLYSFLKWCGIHSLIILCCHNIDMMCCKPYHVCNILGFDNYNEIVALRLLVGAMASTATYVYAHKVYKKLMK